MSDLALLTTLIRAGRGKASRVGLTTGTAASGFCLMEWSGLSPRWIRGQEAALSTARALVMLLSRALRRLQLQHPATVAAVVMSTCGTLRMSVAQ